MRYTEAQWLRSELGTVERFLAELPADAVIERLSWTSRLEAVREQLAELEGRPQAHPLSLTFRGEPVEGLRSIDASFAGKAVRAFVEATDTVTASLVTDELHDRGRLPGKRARSLRIVDTTVGSFGFELELPPQPPLSDAQQALCLTKTPDPYVEAIAATMKLLDTAATDDEDGLSDLIADIHPRATDKVRAFVQVLADNNAVFAVAFGDKQLRFDRDEQIARVIASLANADISEVEEQHTGTILGVLPESRRFEARLASNTVVQGKLDRTTADIGKFKTMENRLATLRFRVVRVRSRTRYVLIDAEMGPETASPITP